MSEANTDNTNPVAPKGAAPQPHIRLEDIFERLHANPTFTLRLSSWQTQQLLTELDFGTSLLSSYGCHDQRVSRRLFEVIASAIMECNVTVADPPSTRRQEEQRQQETPRQKDCAKPAPRWRLWDTLRERRE